MQRGIVKITKQELNSLIYSINSKFISKLTSDKLSIDFPKKVDTVTILLSEEEVETILDSIDYSKLSKIDSTDQVCNKLQAFLITLRKSK